MLTEIMKDTSVSENGAVSLAIPKNAVYPLPKLLVHPSAILGFFLRIARMIKKIIINKSNDVITKNGTCFLIKVFICI